jgi:hypothetical protein
MRHKKSLNIKRDNQGPYTEEHRQEELEDTKGVRKSRTPKKEIQKEFEDTKGGIRDCTPKKDRQ